MRAIYGAVTLARHGSICLCDPSRVEHLLVDLHCLVVETGGEGLQHTLDQFSRWLVIRKINPKEGESHSHCPLRQARASPAPQDIP
jgi:hypothetical protein